jgi:putative flippase GtrA
MKTTFIQLLRFGVVGVASNALGCGYLLLTWLGVGPKTAMSLLFLIGTVQTFVFNKRWTFEHGGAHGPVFYRYASAYFAGYLVNLAVLHVLVDRLGQPHQLVQGVMILVMAVLLFLAQKFWVFRASPNAVIPKDAMQ